MNMTIFSTTICANEIKTLKQKNKVKCYCGTQNLYIQKGQMANKTCL